MAIASLVFAFRNKAVQMQIRIKGTFSQRPPNRIPLKFHCPEFGHSPNLSQSCAKEMEEDKLPPKERDPWKNTQGLPEKV